MTDPTPNGGGDDLAGEYVLGTLSSKERRAAESRLRTDARFAQAVADWEMRLSPLALTMQPARPPAGALDGILALIGGGNAAKAARAGPNVLAFRRQISLWRGIAAATTALAAALALFIVIRPPTLEGRYVAVLNAQGPEAPFMVTIDLASQTVSIRRAGAEPQSGKSYEVWAVGGGRDKPQSLGVIDARLEIPAGRLGGFDPATVFAVSLEPAGGSPTGQPTGPVLYTGKLYPFQ
jgi:anti-sigma-K factor RskA